MSSQRSVAVIGSLNIDFVTRTSRIPQPGETLQAISFDTGFGGKGANQAVGAARLAGEDVKVRMIGAVGDDGFGSDYFEALGKEGIDTSGIRRLKGEKTGVTNIVVDETGENRIMFVANANMKFDDSEDLVSDQEGDVVVFQLEIPFETVLYNMRKAREHGRHVMFNPAPAVKLPEDSYANMDTLIMNETEAAILSGQAETSSDRDTLLQRCETFLRKGVRQAVVITLGGDGLVYATASGASGHVSAHKVKVVDTTAAGDTFVGGYAVRRARHVSGEFDYKQALEFATLAASKTVKKHGAMAAIPYLKDL
ncbi:Putative ribokinase/fructokinase, carbohydrate/purine kinase, PfkB, carbohydrate kinase PfkB [Septoria linicola]|uniref:Ribokinase n=1 Tax=Septoria linicola TaxID=215465 RepID=A0A9Q9ASL9_9PEZI|nr:Putative ribokinase/fructokinase, carbohydrate/purine kinase, PfkB, carbohydrate kinase PfkB [Septoria linicola]